MQEISNEPQTIPFLGNWTLLAQLEGAFEKGNSRLPLNVVAELDDLGVVGSSHGRPHGKHYHEFGELVVRTSERRRRVATSMYTYHVLRGMLSGRLFGRDQTISINEVMQEKYLPFLGFTHMVTLRQKVRNFSSLNWWKLDFTPEKLEWMMEQLPEGTEFQGLQEVSEILTEDYHFMEDLLKKVNRPELLTKIQKNREAALKFL